MKILNKGRYIGTDIRGYEPELTNLLGYSIPKRSYTETSNKELIPRMLMKRESVPVDGMERVSPPFPYTKSIHHSDKDY